MQEIINILRSENIPLIPMTVEEINVLEATVGIMFPSVYREFLSSMGKGAGKYMLGSDVFYPDVLCLNRGAKELIADNNLTDLPKNSFVFWMHQGYQMAFFDNEENDDPTIYYFSESSDMSNFVKKTSLSEFFKSQLILSGIITEKA